MTLTVRNCLLECRDGKRHERLPERITVQAHHRISFARIDDPIDDAMLTGPLIAEQFRDETKFAAGSYTGGEMPYTFVGRADGTIDQCLEVGDTGPHAAAWNARAIGIAWVGDFRRTYMTPEQQAACIAFSALWMAWGARMHGHTELPGASTNPDKQCPGKLFRLLAIRHIALRHPYAQLSQGDAEWELLRLGVVF